MDKRIGTISIFIENQENIDKVNRLLTEFSDIIVSRMGVPYRQKKVAVIVIIVDGTNDSIGALGGKLGNIKNIQVKTVLSKI